MTDDVYTRAEGNRERRELRVLESAERRPFVPQTAMEVLTCMRLASEGLLIDLGAGRYGANKAPGFAPDRLHGAGI